ncbi:TPA: DUF551 domain-containing protein [Burkholderia vietnamiensis]|nr:DUF551 domain-containing protein [Burkholderia vietnamiensis]HDR9261407.1 DUF551 domain-containing protein [Burkholderia vietnamiensis]
MDERKMFDATLVELSQRDEETFDKPFPNDDINVLWALWQAARRTTPDREAWISVDERLPEAHTFWLVCAETDEGLTVQSMYFDGKNWIHEGEPTFCHSYMLRPTHWMPLPAAPGQTPVASPRDTLIEEIAEMVDHMGEGRRLEEYVGAIREMKGGKS